MKRASRLVQASSSSLIAFRNQTNKSFLSPFTTMTSSIVIGRRVSSRSSLNFMGNNYCNFDRNISSLYHTCLKSAAEDRSTMDGSRDMHGTTVLCVRKAGKVCLQADGQVTLGNVVMKGNARKLRQIGQDVIAGFAGSTADAITLFERLESKLEEYPGQLMRACVEMAKLWRTDKYLRKLEAVMIVADKNITLIITGNGDVLEPTEGGANDSVVGIGSGGHYAISAAKALLDVDGFDAEAIAQKAMLIAGEICIYTNTNFTKLILEEKDGKLEITEK
ncbi:hypothetical protein FDP41_008960 [Naegleria fowleri]|uniref:ATP-dependent protease subunit HslV n=1 Tax=Naegleria fowleri TaxID=5763 RepID=A0A6A5BDP7_NAEFO|nr:uncharacterized protein FDP41_008960 [Naegleria fowleri]KAF0972711.1 hypothetical protein FDP41_008960 [Naegleria fowleri]